MDLIWSHLVRGLLLGLSLGGTCLLTCGPVYAPYLMMRKINPTKSILSILEISLGRLIAYAAIGALLGWLGLQIAPEHKLLVTAIGYMLVTVMLFVSAFRQNRRDKGCAVSKMTGFADRPFIVGLVTGINLCPPFLGVVVDAVDISGPVAGILVFVAFFVGSSIWLLPVIIFGIMSNKTFMRRVALWGSVVVGIWFAAQSAKSAVDFYESLSAQKAAASDTRPVVNLLEGKENFVLSDDSSSVMPLIAALRQHQNGKGETRCAGSLESVPQNAYVFVSSDWDSKHPTADSTYKKGGRFAVILPVPTAKVDSAYAVKIVTFFAEFYFRSDRNGSMFRMKAMPSSGEILP